MKKFEKPVVPQYVADWYEENKDNFEDNLAYLLNDYLNKNFAFIEDSNLKVWLDNDFNLNKPIQTLVNMHQFGYTVKKEKLYTVEIPNPNGSSKVYLGKNEYGKVELFTWVITQPEEFADDWKKEKNVQLTEDEIKEDFAYLWEANLPKEVKDN